MPLPSAQHRLVLPYSNQRQGTPSHGTRGNTLPCAFFRSNTPSQSHTRFAVLADRQPFSFSRRALCVKEQGGTTGTGTSRHRTSYFVRASTSRPPRRLRARRRWPQRQLPPGSCSQLPDGSAIRESTNLDVWQHPAVGRTSSTLVVAILAQLLFQHLHSQTRTAVPS
jgi:hypothetical protein